MQPETDAPLASLTTLRLGGPARRLHTATTTDAVLATVRAADEQGIPLLVLGGGSNLVVGDDGFPGDVLRIATTGLRVDGTDVSVEAGVPWDDVVTAAVAAGLSGIECLAGIPGSAGATPVQNVGAYGQEVAETIASVEVYDRTERAPRTLTAAECGFTYRHSVFKGDDRYVVLRVRFRLRDDAGRSAPIRYAELARTLGVEPGERVPVEAARAAVLGLRRGKGMVLDPADHDTWSAGSFFTNPILTHDAFADLTARAARHLGPDVTPPRYPSGADHVKTSAAWLIERAGFPKGYGQGRARISTKHTLALTNRGRASTEDLLSLAREVRDGVHATFGVTLINEPVLINAKL
ncbi:UDP-N-acetylmuramate dehydrogenase [Embleya sp. NBC_00888]|uniref:UDP-N-acetylmuramate dehydrogenase n=1 Tax=Embleya sp. NBC_00888 TaxID=2975960 RepID=UPI003870C486|nr:UDP-N-acetylmuramate dehydrogenase [Embleya sp. NBC_00888]